MTDIKSEPLGHVLIRLYEYLQIKSIITSYNIITSRTSQWSRCQYHVNKFQPTDMTNLQLTNPPR